MSPTFLFEVHTLKFYCDSTICIYFSYRTLTKQFLIPGNNTRPSINNKHPHTIKSFHLYFSDILNLTMGPEKRTRKKTVVYDPHPPGTKHQMMSERSKKVKDKKKNKERMRKVREEAKDKEAGEASGAVGPVEKDTSTEKEDAPNMKNKK